MSSKKAIESSPLDFKSSQDEMFRPSTEDKKLQISLRKSSADKEFIRLPRAIQGNSVEIKSYLRCGQSVQCGECGVYMLQKGAHFRYSMDSDVVITALGVVNALGGSVAEVSSRLFAGDQSGISSRDGFLPGRRCFVGAVTASLPPCPTGFEAVWSRNAALSVAALEQIQGDVRRAIARYGRTRIGVVVGSSTSGIDEGERAVVERMRAAALPAGYDYVKQQMGSVSSVLSRILDISGPSYTVSTACSSSAKVFRAALNLIHSGMCDCVVTGGIDSLCKLTLNGFSALELVSGEITNPFSKNRQGISIGEGGALFLLERAETLATDLPYVTVSGVGESSDAYHISSPDPTGAGAVTAICLALEGAGIEPEEIDYVNLHGTGTLHNDAMEAQAIRSVFSDSVPCSSTKPLVGHMLGASGATELAFCWMVLTDPHHRLPPHRFDGVVDPALPAVRLVGCEERLPAAPRFVLSNSFGFGGSNCAVVLGRRGYGA